MLVWTVGLVWLTLGCSNEFNTDDEVVPEDTGRDTVPNPDSEEPDDTDTRIPDDTPADTTPTFCDEDLSLALSAPGSAGLGACIAEEMRLPASSTSAPVRIDATNANGSTHYDRPYYNAVACASTESTTAHFDAPERVYFLALPPRASARLTLDKQCSRNLEMRIIRHAEFDTCPNQNNTTIECQRDASAGGSGNQKVQLDSAQNWLFYDIVIDGRNDTIANYKLTLECLTQPSSARPSPCWQGPAE